MSKKYYLSRFFFGSHTAQTVSIHVWFRRCIINSNDSSEIKIRNSLIKCSNCKKLLGIKIDTKLTFDDHITDMSRKANSKLCALGRITLYVGIITVVLLQHSLTTVSLTWTFHGRSNNNKITHLHEGYFRLIDSDKFSSYKELLERDGSVSIHQKEI